MSRNSQNTFTAQDFRTRKYKYIRLTPCHKKGVYFSVQGIHAKYSAVEKIRRKENAPKNIMKSHYAGISPEISFIINAQEDSHLFRWEMICANLISICYNFFVEKLE